MMIIVQHFVIYCKNFVSKNKKYVTKIFVHTANRVFTFTGNGESELRVLLTILTRQINFIIVSNKLLRAKIVKNHRFDNTIHR